MKRIFKQFEMPVTYSWMSGGEAWRGRLVRCFRKIYVFNLTMYGHSLSKELKTIMSIVWKELWPKLSRSIILIWTWTFGVFHPPDYRDIEECITITALKSRKLTDSMFQNQLESQVARLLVSILHLDVFYFTHWSPFLMCSIGIALSKTKNVYGVY